MGSTANNHMGTEGNYILSNQQVPITVTPVLSDQIKQEIFLVFQTDGCLLLYESSAESSCMSFLHYFHSAISNHLSITISMSPDWMVAQNRSNCTLICSQSFEPRHEKTGFLHMRKTKTQISFTVTAKLISAFVFAT